MDVKEEKHLLASIQWNILGTLRRQHIPVQLSWFHMWWAPCQHPDNLQSIWQWRERHG